MTLRQFFRSFGFIALFVWAFFVWTGPVAAASHSPDLHHDLAVTLEPVDGRLVAVDRIRIKGGGPAGFRLMPGLTLKGVRVDGREVRPHGGDGQWRINLGPVAEHKVVIEYAGMPASPAFIDPGGSYLPEGADWIPRMGDQPFTYRVSVDVPEQGRAVVPGRLESEEVSQGRYRATFSSEAPAWGVVLLASSYQVSERLHGAIRLRTYFDPKLQDLAADYLDSVAGYLDFYSAWIGKYPFSAFHIVSGPLPVGLGYPNLTYMGSRVLQLPFIRHSSLGHEVLHSWWGNGVYIDGEGGNWAEGLTTFMADYTLAERRKAGAGREMRRGWLRDYAALPAERDRPAVQFRSKGHDASQVVGYNKVAFFFHMLRRKLGAEKFDQGLQRFWKDHRFRAAGWDDLRHAFENEAFETASGRDLAEFFGQWLNRAGAPRLSLGPVTARKAEDSAGGHVIDLTLRQQPPVYALDLPVVVRTEHGEQVFTVQSSTPQTRVRLEIRHRPLALLVDPDNHVFRRLDPSESPPILRHITLNAQTRTLVLADPPDRAAARALAERMLDTPPRFLQPGSPMPSSPLFIIGSTARVGAFLERTGLPAPPDAVAGEGTARVWTHRRDGQLVLVVAADNGPSLQALLNPLPHYGRQGYLVFDGGKVVKRGLGMGQNSPLNIWFD